MKNKLMLLSIILFTFIGCERGFELTEIDSPIEIAMTPDLDNPTKKLVLKCETTETYPCSNYGIKTSCNKLFGNISINFQSLIVPDLCLASFGSATTNINLGSLSNGTHKFETEVNGAVSKGELIVSDEKYVLKIDNPNQIIIVEETLCRVPENTIWGAIHYCDSSYANVVEELLDSVQLLGGSNESFIPGDYYYFFIQNNGEILNTQDEGYYFTKHFVYTYQTDFDEIHKLMQRYKQRYSQQVYFSLYNDEGEFHWQ